MLLKQTAHFIYTERTLMCFKFHKSKHKDENCDISNIEVRQDSVSRSPEGQTHSDVINHVDSSRSPPTGGATNCVRSHDQRTRSHDQETPQSPPPRGGTTSPRVSIVDSEGKDITSDDVDNTSDVTTTGLEENYTLSPIFAVTVLILYILTGATMYGQWERWDYFESAYFIFTSLTTIGFGDLTPAHPKFFISSSIYIFVGLTLVSLVINTIIDTLKKGMKKAKSAPAVILKRHQKLNLKKKRDSYEEIAVHHPLEHGDSVQLASIRIPRDTS